MERKNDIVGTNDCADTGDNRVENDGPGFGRADLDEPEVLVEFVVIDGAEGKRLHAIQAEVVRRVLSRIADREMQKPQKRSRL